MKQLGKMVLFLIYFRTYQSSYNGFKWAIPGRFFIYFRLFKQTLQFYNKYI